MALDLKSVVRNQVASRTSRGLKAGLTKVAGNILGSALGSASPTNAPFIGAGGAGPFAIDMLSFPNDVAGDPSQGHYINFSIFENTPAKVSAGEVSKKVKQLAAFVKPVPKLSGTELLDISAGDQHIAGLTGAAKRSLEKDLRAGSRTGNKSINEANSLRLRRNSTNRIGGNISLYMPPNISVSYNANYTDEPIGAVAESGMAVVDALKGGATEQSIGDNIEAALGGAEQAIREKVLGLLQAGFSGARALYAIEQGQVITPRLELMFNNMGRRDFSYTFVFIPRELNESVSVERIVKKFKSNMAADFKEDMGTIAGMRTMGIPNIFKIEYMYQGALNTHLNAIGFCALRNVEVSYGSDRFVSYEGGYPQTTKLTLAFTEMDIITRTMIEQGR